MHPDFSRTLAMFAPFEPISRLTALDWRRYSTESLLALTPVFTIEAAIPTACGSRTGARTICGPADICGAAAAFAGVGFGAAGAGGAGCGAGFFFSAAAAALSFALATAAATCDAMFDMPRATGRARAPLLARVRGRVGGLGFARLRARRHVDFAMRRTRVKLPARASRPHAYRVPTPSPSGVTKGLIRPHHVRLQSRSEVCTLMAAFLRHSGSCGVFIGLAVVVGAREQLSIIRARGGESGGGGRSEFRRSDIRVRSVSRAEVR